MTKVYLINKAENYAKQDYGIAKADVKEMYDKKDIFDVNRSLPATD